LISNRLRSKSMSWARSRTASVTGSFTGKYRYSDDSGVARSQRSENHHNLYPYREKRYH
jgi:hypothetical protein